MSSDPRLAQARYTIRRKVLKLVGGAFTVFDAAGNTVLYSEQKAFTLKEDIRIFDGPQMAEEILRIAAGRVIDVSAVYDVFDARTDACIGSLQRRGVRSVLKDEWWILDTHGQQIGTITEDSIALALVRRFLLNLIPQTYSVHLGGVEVAELKQHVNPFVYRIEVDFTKDPQLRLDRRLGLAAGILMAAVEGRQS